MQPRQDDIRAQGKEIHKLLRDTMDNIKPDKKGYVWLQYVDYVNGLIIEGITSAINSSMQYLSDQINIKMNVTNMWAPIFDIKVDLLDDELSFQPAIGCNDRQTGIRDIINEFVNDFISIAIQIQRVDNKEAAAGDYLVEIKDQFQLFGTMQEISNHLDEITSKGSSFLDQYRQWDFLWKQEVESSFQEFLLQGTDLKDIYVKECTSKYMSDDTEEMENNMRNAMDRYSYLEKKVFNGVTTRAPDLQAFDKKIEFLHSVKNSIDGQKVNHDIGWLKVSSQKLIEKLHATVNEWIEKYTQFLLQNTTSEITNIQNFIERVKKGIENLPERSETQ